jgi:hypothetical protein
MDSQVFFHHFYASKSQHPDVFWSERLPWKVGPALRPKDVGWGIHLEESPDWPLFAALMCLLLLWCCCGNLRVEDGRCTDRSRDWSVAD